MPGQLFEGNPVDEGTTGRSTDAPVHLRKTRRFHTHHEKWWPKYWSFSFSISPSSEHPGLISFRMDWLDLLAVQGILKSLFQYHNLKASVLQVLNHLRDFPDDEQGCQCPLV